MWIVVVRYDKTGENITACYGPFPDESSAEDCSSKCLDDSGLETATQEWKE